MPRKSYEDEIRELLNRMDTFLPDGGRGRRAGNSVGAWWRQVTAGRQVQPLTPHRLMAAAIILMLFSWLFTLFPPLLRLAGLTSLASVILFVTALVLAVRTGMRPTFGGSQLWRGRVIELPRGNWALRLRQWWRSRRPPI